MIDYIGARNLKSWPSLRHLRLNAITGLFGVDSSGKSSILQLLLLMKQTSQSPDRAQVLNLGDERDLVELGTFKDIVYGHDLDKTFICALHWSLGRRLTVTDVANPRRRVASSDELMFAVSIEAEDDGLPFVQQASYWLNDKRFFMRSKPDNPQKYSLDTEADDFRFIRTRGRKWDLPPPVKCYGFPDQAKAYFQNAGFLSDFQLEFERLFDRLFYLGPLREHPQRQYIWAGGQPEDVGRKGERVVDALLATRTRERISRGKGKPRLSVEEYTAFWLSELGLISSFEVRPVAEGSNIYHVWVRQTEDAPEVLISDVGFGVSQILPVIVLCYYVPEGSIVVFEQPELRLHPAVQAGLADLFIDAIKVRNIQIIFESHSEHLLQRLQRRIAEETVSQEQIALYFTQRHPKTSSLTPLKLDSYGNITNWPEHFFGDLLSENAAIVSAKVRRNRSKA
jgi:predicted ATPase